MLGAGILAGGVFAPLPVHAAAARTLDADAVLAQPPATSVKFASVGDTRMAFIDGKPCSLLGWGAIVNHNVDERSLEMMLKESDFPTARLVVPLGKPVPPIAYGAPSWTGPDTYNWEYLDGELARLTTANPEIKVILNLVFDSPDWWGGVYPDAVTAEGKADYLSSAWQREGDKALRQLIAHLQSGSYAETVIGYTLFNGGSLDCNWSPDIFTAAALGHFRDFLRERYQNDAALQRAWQDDTVTLAAATPTLDYAAEKERYPLIFVPSRYRRLADSIEFADWAQNLFMRQFAATVKEATQHRRLAGVRTGNLLFGFWGRGFTSYGQYAQWGGDRHYELLDDPNIDYLEQWDPYPGRGLGDWGSLAPVNPVRGLALKGKAMVLQDDVRPHIGEDRGYGATANLEETLAKQKLVYLNAMTQGMNPYLWQMSYTYAIPEVMPLWRQLQDIWQRSFQLPRRSVAEVAVVVDADMQRFIGRDLEFESPTRGFALLDYPRYTWARGGAAYDMILLDQVADSDYKVYVFFHTFKLDAEEIAAIHRTLAANHAVAFFVWNDGVIDGGEAFSIDNASRLAGMKLALSEQELSWQMRPEPELIAAGFDAGRALGVLDRQEPGEPAEVTARVYPPTLTVEDAGAVALGRSADMPEKVVLAQKAQEGWTAIYSQSPILAPGLLRYAIREAGAFEYLDSDDALFVNSDFIGVHTRSTTRQVTLRLPEPGMLYEPFRQWELAEAEVFTLEVEPKETYWFFRGSRVEWEALSQEKSR